jgi:glycosyltransferase involved in cell wall biosynthesis
MLLEAAAPLVRERKVTIEVIGDGPQMAELKGIVERESAGSGVTFSGWIDHGKLQDRYLEADVFAFPSIREFGGGVALEAMALGVVPIVVNYGGPAELVTENTGFLIPIGPRRQIIAHLRDLLIGLVEDPSAVESRAPAAIRRAEKHFTWPAKAQQILEVYRWVLDGRIRKPDFGMPLPD